MFVERVRNLYLRYDELIVFHILDSFISYTGFPRVRIIWSKTLRIFIIFRFRLNIKYNPHISQKIFLPKLKNVKPKKVICNNNNNNNNNNFFCIIIIIIIYYII